MSQPYNYARQYKILNPTDDYTHIMIEAGFIDGDYSGYQKTVLDANMRDEIFKKRNSSELAKYLVASSAPAFTYKSHRPAGFNFRIYAIKRSSPEYGRVIYQQNNGRSYYYYASRTVIPLDATPPTDATAVIKDEDKLTLEPTVIQKEMTIFIAPSERFKVTTMRQIENQFNTILKGQLNVAADGSVTVLNNYDINIDDFEEFAII